MAIAASAVSQHSCQNVTLVSYMQIRGPRCPAAGLCPFNTLCCQGHELISSKSFMEALLHLQLLCALAWQQQAPACLLPPDLWLQHTLAPHPQCHLAAQKPCQMGCLHTNQHSIATNFSTTTTSQLSIQPDMDFSLIVAHTNV